MVIEAALEAAEDTPEEGEEVVTVTEAAAMAPEVADMEVADMAVADMAVPETLTAVVVVVAAMAVDRTGTATITNAHIDKKSFMTQDRPSSGCF